MAGDVVHILLYFHTRYVGVFFASGQQQRNYARAAAEFHRPCPALCATKGGQQEGVCAEAKAIAALQQRDFFIDAIRAFHDDSFLGGLW
jgi:hypothetical protein